MPKWEEWSYTSNDKHFHNHWCSPTPCSPASHASRSSRGRGQLDSAQAESKQLYPPSQSQSHSLPAHPVAPSEALIRIRCHYDYAPSLSCSQPSPSTAPSAPRWLATAVFSSVHSIGGVPGLILLRGIICAIYFFLLLRLRCFESTRSAIPCILPPFPLKISRTPWPTSPSSFGGGLSKGGGVSQKLTHLTPSNSGQIAATASY